MFLNSPNGQADLELFGRDDNRTFKPRDGLVVVFPNFIALLVVKTRSGSEDNDALYICIVKRNFVCVCCNFSETTGRTSIKPGMIDHHAAVSVKRGFVKSNFL